MLDHEQNNMSKIAYLSRAFLLSEKEGKFAYKMRMAIDTVYARNFIKEIIKLKGMRSPSALSYACGMAKSTLTRFYNGRTEAIGLQSLSKVAQFAGYKSYEDYIIKKTLSHLVLNAIPTSAIEENRDDIISQLIDELARTRKKPEETKNKESR